MPRLGLRLPEFEVRSKKVIKNPSSAVEVVAETIDDVADAVIGGRPASRILRALVHIAPAPTFERLTGLPAPGKVIDTILDRIADEVEKVEQRVLPGARKAKAVEEEILE